MANLRSDCGRPGGDYIVRRSIAYDDLPRLFLAQRLEVPLYLMLVCLAMLIRGGGALSLDRAIGRKL